jgi:hypothetical protein
MSFEAWKAKVDNLVAEQLSCLTTDDLPDQMYWDMYEQGDSPEEVASETVELFLNGEL